MKKICDLCVDSGMCPSLGRDMCLNTVGLEEIGPKDRTQSYRWLGDKNRLWDINRNEGQIELRLGDGLESIPGDAGRREKPMTNADRIRNMSNDELVDLLVWNSIGFFGNVPDCSDSCEDFRGGCAYNCPNEKKERAVREWLEKEED